MMAPRRKTQRQIAKIERRGKIVAMIQDTERVLSTMEIAQAVGASYAVVQKELARLREAEMVYAKRQVVGSRWVWLYAGEPIDELPEEAQVPRDVPRGRTKRAIVDEDLDEGEAFLNTVPRGEGGMSILEAIRTVEERWGSKSSWRRKGARRR